MQTDIIQPETLRGACRSLASRILVAAADDGARARYCQSFQLGGCHAIEASDRRDALTKAFASPSTPVVTEIRLPLLDGDALCEILRCDSATADMLILVGSGYAHPAEMHGTRWPVLRNQ